MATQYADPVETVVYIKGSLIELDTLFNFQTRETLKRGQQGTRRITEELVGAPCRLCLEVSKPLVLASILSLHKRSETGRGLFTGARL